MKKLYFVLLLIIVSFGLAIAGDTIKVLRIYNGGVGTTIPLTNIDSLKHPKKDINGNLQTEHVNAVLETIDSLYNIPVASIDSIVVADVDVEEFLSHIESIQTYIAAQGEQEVNLFQKKLIDWLDTQKWVSQTFINDTKDFIIITFTSGLELFISFQDAAFFDDSLEGDKSRMHNSTRASDKEKKYVEVSYQEDEEIIEKKDVLYIQCRDMLFSNASSELNLFNDALLLSPIQLKLSVESCNLEVLTKNWSNFGLVFISQTHGVRKGTFLDGSFSIEDPQHPFKAKPYTSGSSSHPIYFTPMLEKYIKDGLIVNYNAPTLYCINPKLIAQKLNPKSIYYGSYCWSYYLSKTTGSTVFGYKGESNYFYNKKALVKFIEELSSGFTVSDAIRLVEEADFFMYGMINNQPSLNKDSKQRYFSISTNDVDEDKDDDDKPKISGTINGYDNLKKDDLNYILYVHESDDVENTFTPEVAKDGEGWILGTNKESYLESFTIDEKGNFSLTYPGTIIPGKNYGYIFAFEYKDKYYYGELKNYKKEKKEDIVIDEEVVDLGLSVKWATQNLGASAPNELGNKYDIDDFKVKAFNEHPELFKDGGTKADFCKTDYDYAYKALGGGYRMPSYEELKDLKEKCKWELATIGDVAGFKITGPSGKYIFLPTVSTYEEFDNFGSIYTLDRTVYSSGTYDNEIGWSLASISISGVLMPMFESLSTLTVTFDNDKEAYIRPVCE